MKELQDILRLEDLNESNFERIFQSYFKTKDVKVLEIGGQCELDGVNVQYNSDIKKTSLKLCVDGKEQEVHTVIKVPMDDLFHTAVGKLSMTFAKEIFWYLEGSQILGSKFPDLIGLTPSMFHGASSLEQDFLSPGCCREHCCFLAWCLCARKEQGIMIMEDLTKLPQPYNMYDKMKVLPMEYAKMVVEKVAHFHGAWWLILNNKLKLDNFPLSLAQVKNIYAMKGASGLKIMLSKMVKTTVQHIAEMRKSRGDDQIKIDRMLKSVKNMTKFIFSECYGNNDNSVFRTVIHGDLWNNNILFQSNPDGSAKDVKFIDFQVSTLAHPAVDLNYFLYIGTDRQFREQHLKDLLKSYYDVLSSYLSPHQPEVTFEQFHQEYQERRVVGLLGCVLLMPNMLNPDQVEFKGLNGPRKLEEHRRKLFISENQHPSITELRRRIMDMVDEFEELDFFEKYLP